jgi:hypothetical protein
MGQNKSKVSWKNRIRRLCNVLKNKRLYGAEPEVQNIRHCLSGHCKTKLVQLLCLEGVG